MQLNQSSLALLGCVRCSLLLAMIAVSVCHVAQLCFTGWLGGVVVRMSDLRLAVVGSNPGHGIAGLF